GSAITHPLSRATGRLEAMPATYDPALVASTSARRLAVYNRQYWFRLFDVLQSAFPLTMRLTGAWNFNAIAAHFLEESPPRGWDVDHATDGFERFVEITNEPPVVVEAARIDAAWLRVFRAPRATPFRPTSEDAPRLPSSHLVPSPALAFVEEHFALAALRRRVLREHGESKIDAPPELPKGRTWAIVRRDAGTFELALEPREAELHVLLRSRSVGDALAELEARCSDEERAALPANAQRWLARSVENDFWVGLDQSQMTQL
ncbi:MAG: DNA-binding domain-containing protein, partial [Polyangiaceae bacterium]